MSGDSTPISPQGPPAPARGHRQRRAARRLAIDLLYQADINGQRPSDVVAQWRAAGRAVDPYAEQLVDGVQDGIEQIDRSLGSHAEGWTVARFAAVDRAILRVACYEMLSGVPAAVAINEAVDVAGELSTEASGRFINGVLGKFAQGLTPKADGREAEPPD